MTAVFEPLFLNDAEIAKRLGMTSAEWHPVAQVLERSGLPRKDPLFGGRRCWPSVQSFLLRRSAGGDDDVGEQPGRIVEDLDALRSTGKRRARA